MPLQGKFSSLGLLRLSKSINWTCLIMVVQVFNVLLWARKLYSWCNISKSTLMTPNPPGRWSNSYKKGGICWIIWWKLIIIATSGFVLIMEFQIWFKRIFYTKQISNFSWILGKDYDIDDTWYNFYGTLTIFKLKLYIRLNDNWERW